MFYIDLMEEQEVRVGVGRADGRGGGREGVYVTRKSCRSSLK